MAGVRSLLGLRRCWYQVSLRSVVTSATKRNNTTELKFDPTRSDGDFTSFGVLPFIQKNINDLLLAKNTPYYDGKPVTNVGPTRDQRSFLSVLGSDYSVVFKGDGTHTGKSFAMATYTLNHALSRVPRHRLLQFHSTVDSIILVPTREMVFQYHQYFSQLTKGLPDNCCPEKLVPTEDDEYEVEFRPLTIEFRTPDSKAFYISSKDGNAADIDSDSVPQILVTTPQQLGTILASPRRAKEVSEAKVICVDETTTLLSTTSISGNDTLLQEGKKKKYMSKLEVCIKQIQSIQFESFQKESQLRLERIERHARRIRDEEISSFNHSSFVMANNNLSITNIESQIISGEPNIGLLKRLIKEKRKVLYKPIQFAFICDKMTPNHMFANMAIANDRSHAITNAITMHERSAHFIRSVEEKVHETYGKYLHTKRQKDIHRFEDPITYYIEAISRFSNDMRKTRRNERRLITVGSGPMDMAKYNHQSQIELSIIEVDRSPVKKNRVVVKDIDINQEYHHLVTETQSLILRRLENELFNLENSQKNFLKSFEPTKITSLLIKKAVTQVNSSKGLLLVVPASSAPDIPELVNTLNTQTSSSSYVHYKIETIQDFQSLQDHFVKEEAANLIISADQLLGRSFPGCTNIIALGLETLYPQLAYSTNAKGISGLEHTNGDLFIPFINALDSNVPDITKRFTIVLNHVSKSLDDAKRNQNYKKLAELMIFNDIPRHFHTSRLTKTKDHHILSYEEF